MDEAQNVDVQIGIAKQAMEQAAEYEDKAEEAVEAIKKLIEDNQS
jgi:hypothetical protein